MRVLVIEDDENHAQFICDGLRQAGHNVDLSNDGRDGLFLATEEKYDVMIVDRMIPKLDGLTIIKTLRSANIHTPILTLSSLSNVEERVKGLKAGSDDYLSKPFEFSELLARVEALTRRASTEQAEQTNLAVGELEMNLLTRVVRRKGKIITLQHKEYQLLEYLMRRVDQVVTRTMLLEGVWDFHFNPNTNLIDAQMSKLRQKIDAEEFGYGMIQTLRGSGYKLSAEQY